MARLSLVVALLALFMGEVRAQQTPDVADGESPEAEGAEGAEGPAPRYLGAVRSELTRLDVDASCEVLDPLRARCSWVVQNTERTRELVVRALIDEGTRTLYLFAPIAVAHPDDTETEAVLRRSAELNWRHLATKVEWNSATGEVRMSALQHLDTNFDRRAFRVLARLIGRQALAAAAEIGRLIPEH